VNAIHLQDGRASIDQDTCRGCGRCAEACPSKAIEMRISDGLFIDKTIEAIERIVDVM
jgi:Fe-S-cluster-containing hydrogenase component 2